jgi:NADH dehydrogenase
MGAVNATGAGNVAAAAAALGARALIHVSALGAAPGSRSAFARSKAAGEDAVRAAFPTAAIVRPAPIFGPEDDFTNRFARILALSPVMPVIAPDARLQPVFVCDVAEAIAAILDRQMDDGPAGTFELAGPDAMTMRDFLRFIAAASGHQRLLIEAPDFGARMLAGPASGVGADELALLTEGLVASGDAADVRELGLIPTPLGGVADEWLARYRPGGRFATAA